MSGLVVACGAIGLVFLYSGLVRPSTATPRMVEGLRCLAAEAGAAWTGRRIVLACVGTGSTGSTIALLFVPSPVVAILALAGGCVAPISYLRARRERRRRRLREVWPDALAGLNSSIRAGASLAEACNSMCSRGPAELRSAFETFRSTYRATGSFETALGRLEEVLADPIADRVVAALRLAYQVGGTDLVRVLRTLSDFVREDVRVRKEIEARWSWTVTAARVAAAAPWLVLALMSTRPEAAAAYNSPTGAAVLSVGAIATVAGYRLMLRAGRLPEERRLRDG